MLVKETQHTQASLKGDLPIALISPVLPDYPNARFPAVIVWSEIYQGYLVACPAVYHEFEGDRAIPYESEGTDLGNKLKVQKELASYDADFKAAVDFVISLPNCTGRVGATGMCLGGHLAFRNALDTRVLASVCYFPTDIHSKSLSSGDDTLERAAKGELKGETILIFGVQDGHIPLEGRSLIRDTLAKTNTRVTFLELQANHAFIRDEMSKGRFDGALAKICFELLLELFGRTIKGDYGERVPVKQGEGKLVC